ncbi:Acyl-CoA synthetase short-chain family member 3, mitochondrial [Zancudomyces culisetae]|uniref:Acyl-CoA synthetase short-chain family member 3, mitochondrial n=1 Tax=Zancudomyces culisetae TaxID=1213189 RepID=A0A1R1PMK3_ZANCU|nr:Acyl-CoA synthetase short-chain family member 3, mitochondrial [Zancudomyces culisetae]OMH82169.1 Acyl-CoA synthetase short-chain family member 3, mitochondrial [Zancudomyces culisetae]|eukprot:OMH79219.1 Acyl-CoA synthetase short-chain family member 3, mitochondrial [Zancudomyces culisetae]
MTPRNDDSNKFVNTKVVQGAMLAESLNNPEQFWLEEAYKNITWVKKPTAAYNFANPMKKYYVDWFADGTLNVCYNALDRHVEQGRGEQAAVIYDSPVTETKQVFTYNVLLQRVKEFAKVLDKNGVGKGDTVIIYMPMIPQTIIAMLACARLGAVHSVVFGGFASPELAKRIDDCKPKVVVSATCGLEGKLKMIKYVPLLTKALEISEHKPKVSIVYQREQCPVKLDVDAGFRYWSDEVASVQESPDVPLAVVESNHPLYILYTSGTTGMPKGVVRPSGPHAVMISWTMKNLYGVKPGEVFFCASDLGWVVGHTYICYAPLVEGSSTILYEGKPIGTPDAGSFFRIMQEYKASVFFTAPTAIVVLRREDNEHAVVKKYDLSTIRGLFMAGERCAPEIHRWWIEHTSGKKITEKIYQSDTIEKIAVDHWWQTESGSPITGVCIGVSEDPKEIAPIQFGSAGMPIVGVDLRVLKVKEDAHAEEDSVVQDTIEASVGEVGDIVIKLPLPPGFFSSLWNDKKRYFESYFKKYPGYYDTGDVGFVDENGYVHIMSRNDDVINVAAHRFSTSSYEEIVVKDKSIAEACTVGTPHEIKGQVPMVFAVLIGTATQNEKAEIAKRIAAQVRSDIGAVASMTPENIIFVGRLPKTRSGKILRKTIRTMVNYAGTHKDNLPTKCPISTPPTIDDPLIMNEIWITVAKLINPNFNPVVSRM